MNILVTGGLGYIGSHTIVELSEKENNIIIVDNLSNSKKEVIDNLNYLTNKKMKLYIADVTDVIQMEKIFRNHQIDTVIHFAGLKSVGESVKNPLKYYKTNIIGTLVLSELSLKYKVKKFVFSSSATVYGNQKPPFTEEMLIGKSMNPYGETKSISEKILIDIAKNNKNFYVTILRYFNPVGAHHSSMLGEDPKGIPNNLMPYISRVANKKIKKLKVFGGDYNTHDGTGVRDYIHVIDLAKGHVSALNQTKENLRIYNLGTGKGYSVLEIVNAYRKFNNVEIPYEVVSRREGDIDIVYSDCSKAKKELKWKAHLGLKDMVVDSWNYEKNNKG